MKTAFALGLLFAGANAFQVRRKRERETRKGEGGREGGRDRDRRVARCVLERGGREGRREGGSLLCGWLGQVRPEADGSGKRYNIEIERAWRRTRRQQQHDLSDDDDDDDNKRRRGGDVEASSTD
jgi:hypothetical protein